MRSETPNGNAATLPASAQLEHDSAPTRLSRSPQPYHRRGINVSNSSLKELRSSSSSRRSSAGNLLDGSTVVFNDSDRRRRRKAEGNASSDSGTEADDEKGLTLLRLPPASLRPSKGLRDSCSTNSPLLTPRVLDENLDNNVLARQLLSRSDSFDDDAQEAARKLRRKFRKKRRAELFRRITETVLFVAICFVASGQTAALYFDGSHASDARPFSQRPVILSVYQSKLVVTFTSIVALIYVAYPLRIIWNNHSRSRQQGKHWFYIHLPAAFDPAPLLYPVGLPLLIAASVGHTNTSLWQYNVTLGLACLPPKIILFGQGVWFHSPQWLISLIPAYTVSGSSLHATPDSHVAEMNALLFPLHRALLPTIHHLATTSLLPSEYQLLSVGLINLLIMASSPQASILRSLLWVGGLTLFLSCAHAMRWEVTLARVPSWKFRKASPGYRGEDVVSWFLRMLSPRRRSINKDSSSSSEEDPVELRRTLSAPVHKNTPYGMQQRKDLNWQDIPKRTNTTSDISVKEPSRLQSRREDRRLSVLRSRTYGVHNLTAKQASVIKWGLAFYVYAMTLGIIMYLIRPQVARMALSNAEPIGWALSYLFGDIHAFRQFVRNHKLNNWIPLPIYMTIESLDVDRLSLSDRLRHKIGLANSRLMISCYCGMIISLGLVVVLRLRKFVEVDTRRKVFHGMMVAMFLPAVFIDPCFISLAMSLILAIFLILDLYRAAQLPPLARPLTTFLAPYVDGRDHRGPVIVSHIFLLIGCAVPLWLSLAGMGRATHAPWIGWEVESRDLSMISGIICVGMGDAAASLIGRRYGRRRWCWTGGKSLEGSAAFIGAVVLGLSIGKIWLYVCGWTREERISILPFMFKTTLAASGASLTEAVLTGGNDNVIVPVVLWILVRGLGL